MAVKFKFDGYEVGQTFWSKAAFVREIATGKTHYPDQAIMSQFNGLVAEVQRRQLSKPDLEFAIGYIVTRFINSVENPGTLHEHMFLTTDAKKFVDRILWSEGTDINLLSTGAEAFGQRLTASLTRSETFHVIFEDDDVCLDFNGGANVLRATHVRTGKHVYATEIERDRHRELIQMARKESGHDDADPLKGILHRTVARALLADKDAPLRQVLFNQPAEVSYQVVRSTIL